MWHTGTSDSQPMVRLRRLGCLCRPLTMTSQPTAPHSLIPAQGLHIIACSDSHDMVSCSQGLRFFAAVVADASIGPRL